MKNVLKLLFQVANMEANTVRRVCGMPGCVRILTTDNTVLVGDRFTIRICTICAIPPLKTPGKDTG